MAPSVWIAFVFVALAVSILPGPAVVAIVSTSLRSGFTAALRTNAGILTGDALFVAAAASGLGALLIASHALFAAIRWLGIAYLAYLGVRAFVGRGTVYAEGTSERGDGAFRLGLTTQLANPKIMLFFASLLPQFVDPRGPVVLQFVVLGLTFIVSDAIVFVGYAALAHQARRFLRSPRAARVTSRATGVAMIGAATALALER